MIISAFRTKLNDWRFFELQKMHKKQIVTNLLKV